MFWWIGDFHFIYGYSVCLISGNGSEIAFKKTDKAFRRNNGTFQGAGNVFVELLQIKKCFYATVIVITKDGSKPKLNFRNLPNFNRKRKWKCSLKNI